MTRLILLGLGLTAAAYALIVVRTAWVIVHPNRRWRPTDWEPLPLNPARVQFRSADGTRLAGWIKPHDNPIATVILVHGLGVNHTVLANRAYRLWQRRFSVMLLDFRACGESEGSTSTCGVREVEDLSAAVDLCMHQPEFGNAPIVALADSLGGTVALAAAAQRSEIKAVFTDCAPVSLRSAIDKGFGAYTGLPVFPFRRAVVWAAERITGESVEDFSVEDSIARIAPRAVCLAHGHQDPLVDVSDAHLMHDRAGEPRELWLEPDVGHVLAAQIHPDTYADRVADFFSRAVASDTDASRPGHKHRVAESPVSPGTPTPETNGTDATVSAQTGPGP
ncbi:MAG: alpha/beta fold hydrolase [Chloroflexi bacterium]|nr:alpha/beta fold hydrolase [Chloroflexota bacterium]